jgi:ABC-type bacteriocin/lantibiotic exporter with double-glycine peptidase domain
VKGNNGSGKSVLLNVLAGLYEDYSGRILYNDTLLRSLNRIDLRSVIGDNLSDEDIFEGTLFENLTMGRAGITEKDVNKRIEEMGLRDFVLDLDRGVYTQLVPHGKNLSRSTVKRILFIRSLLGNPKMILMDDPTSGLDTQSQECVLKCIMNLEDVTVVISSSDERIAKEVDAVIELENGSIKQNG